MNLAAWLQRIQALHPTEIDLGLDRVRRVQSSMGLVRPAPLVITVGGTNGKGSSVAMLQYILLAAGYRVGSYTSPHVHCYNERILINGVQVDDAALCQSFARVEAARDTVSLTYFEFGTLSALWLMEQANLDLAILEVGLGGRLDAVNIVDADLCIISQIALDHTDWLGPDRDSIGREKAGIFRRGVPVICGDPDPPASLLETAARNSAPVMILNRDFGYDAGDDPDWSWWGQGPDNGSATLSGLPVTRLARDHAAIALQALQRLGLKISRTAIDQGLASATLPGRFESLTDPQTGVRVLLDVAHNPAAGERLASRLQVLRLRDPAMGKVAAVLAIMADKDVRGFCTALAPEVDIWYIAQVDQARAMRVSVLAELLDSMGLNRFPAEFEDPAQACRAALGNSASGDLVLVTGSFFTVAAVRDMVLHSKCLT